MIKLQNGLYSVLSACILESQIKALVLRLPSTQPNLSRWPRVCFFHTDTKLITFVCKSS